MPSSTCYNLTSTTQVSKFTEFMKWVESLNHLAGDPGISALKISDDVTIGDRGVVARSLIPTSGGCLLSIAVDDPRLVITPARALRLLTQCSCPSRKLRATTFITTTLEPQDVLVLFFLHIRLASPNEKCDLWRLWRTYFDILPETFSDVAYMSSHEPEMFAKILPVLPMSLKHAFNLQIQKMKNSYKRIFGNSEFQPSVLDFSWAWSVVNSRCVYVNLGRWAEGKDLFPLNPASVPRFRSGCDANIAVVPFFDFFNHSPQVSVSVEVAGGILRLKTNTCYQPGEQVFINYGSHDNLFLLCEYGFCIPGSMNPYEAIYPTYRNLLSITESQKKLNCAIANLQLDVPTEKTEDTIWKSIYIAPGNGPSYYLVLILFAVFSNGEEIPSLDKLYCLNESDRSPPVSQGFRRLACSLIQEHDTALQALLALSNSCLFLEQLITIISSRCDLLRSLV